MAVGEWDQRQLCPDGSCVGVIGPDGTCKVCGRAAPNWGDERKRGLIDPPEEDEQEERDIHDEEDDDYDYDDSGEDDEDEDDDEDGGDEADEAGEAGEAGDAIAASEAAVAGTAKRSDWTARRLCPDGACIGVIGADGHCRVCGRAASDVPDEPSGDGAAANAEAAATASATASSDDDDDDAAAGPDPAPIPATAERERCPDAGCTGSVGTDGRCEVCGKGAS